VSQPRFELQERKDGRWGFNLKAANNEIIATSQSYETRQGAEKGIDAIKAAVTAIVADHTSTVTVSNGS